MYRRVNALGGMLPCVMYRIIPARVIVEIYLSTPRNLEVVRHTFWFQERLRMSPEVGAGFRLCCAAERI